MAPPMESTDPSRVGPDREDLRNIEAMLRPQTNAMARSRKSRRPSSLHRHRLQPQAHHEYSRGASVRVARYLAQLNDRARARREAPEIFAFQRPTPTRAQVSQAQSRATTPSPIFQTASLSIEPQTGAYPQRTCVSQIAKCASPQWPDERGGLAMIVLSAVD